MQQFLPAATMFLLTAFFATLLFLPITKFPQKSPLVRFYWVGFWLFMVAIWTVAGGMNTLMLFEFNSYRFAEAVLFSTTLCFILFVMFGWFRLSALAVMTTAKKVKSKL